MLPGVQIYLDTNHNGVFDSGERPIAGVIVSVVGCSTTQKVVTDAYGLYTFDNLPAGTYTITWWNSSTGQALVKAMNGGQSARNLGNWLARNFTNLFGDNAGTANNLTGKTNAQVAACYQRLYASASRKLETEALAMALSVYVTNSNLAGTVGRSYGFAVSAIGSGAATVNVGASGAAFGIKNNALITITELLSRTNSRARKGVVWDFNGDGSLNAAETVLRNQALSLLHAINST